MVFAGGRLPPIGLERVTEVVSCSRRLSGLLVGSSDIHVTVLQILLNGPNPPGCRMRCAGNFALDDVPGTIPVENLSAAMALVSLDSPLRVQKATV